MRIFLFRKTVCKFLGNIMPKPEIEISNGEGSTIRLLGMQVMVNNKELGAS